MEKWRAGKGLLRIFSNRFRIDHRNNPRFSDPAPKPGSDSTYKSENSFKHFLELRQKLCYSSRDYTRKLQASLAMAYRNCGNQCKFFGSTATEIQRNPCFSTIIPDDIVHFKQILGEKNVIQDKDMLSVANTDWMHKYKGSSQLLLLPRTTEERKSKLIIFGWSILPLIWSSTSCFPSLVEVFSNLCGIALFTNEV